MHDGIDEVGAPTGVKLEMPKYKSYKEVWALEIDKVVRHDEDKTYGLSFKQAGYAPLRLAEGMFSRYTPVSGDFYVVYADGYQSFSPRKAFLEGYNPIEYAPGSTDRPPMPDKLRGPDDSKEPWPANPPGEAKPPLDERPPLT